MGGRGASSTSATSNGSSLKRQLHGIVDQINSIGRPNAGQRDYATIAQTAADLIGTSKLKGLLGEHSLSVLSRELGGSGGTGNLGKLNDLAERTNRPLGMSDATWADLGERLGKLNGAGYTNEEISAVIRFDKWLKETV